VFDSSTYSHHSLIFVGKAEMFALLSCLVHKKQFSHGKRTSLLCLLVNNNLKILVQDPQENDSMLQEVENGVTILKPLEQEEKTSADKSQHGIRYLVTML
jgi:hypothetical protein